jgi:1-acyl-sn-glycerol-3-phosphate acyltransferase
VYGNLVGRGALVIFGVRMLYKDDTRLGHCFPAIYVSNHASNLDPFLGLAMIPIGTTCTAKRAIARIPFFGWVYWMGGHLLLDRSNVDGARRSMAEAAKVVRDNALSLWVYPEGTQPRDGRLLPFKKGIVHVAVATGLPIVPILTHEAHLVWPARTLEVRPGTVVLEVLPPISTADWSLEHIDAHVEELRAIFLEGLRPSQLPSNAHT